MAEYTLYLGDCLEVMKRISDGSVDAIIADLPYGTTACKWDSVIPFEPMWAQLERVIKAGKAIVLFGSEPFSSALRMSNIKNYKYDWIWNKKLAGNGILAKLQPLKVHEIVSVFYSRIYYPIMTMGIKRKKMWDGRVSSEILKPTTTLTAYNNDKYYPQSIQEFSTAGMRSGRVHPTQKPVALMEYLIRTYTNPGETVLDFTMGSGATGIAAMKTNRNFIGIELDPGYFKIAQTRIKNAAGEFVQTDAEKASGQLSLFDK